MSHFDLLGPLSRCTLEPKPGQSAGKTVSKAAGLGLNFPERSTDQEEKHKETGQKMEIPFSKSSSVLGVC